MEELKKIIGTFELSPTILSDIKKKYETLSKKLGENGFSLHVFPQGSIAYGTAIRPFSKDNVKEYDLDILCRIEFDGSISAKDARESITKTLSEIYSDRLHVEESCITLTFSGVEDFVFKIDILVARKNSDYLEPSNLLNDYAYCNKLGQNYKWKVTGAESFVNYFENANSRFLDVAQNDYILRENLPTVTEIPEFMVKSNLQIAIQIIKRLRDVYYASIQSEDRISSHFITFAFLERTSSLPNNASIYEMVKSFVNGVQEFAKKDGFFISKDPILQENMVNVKDYEKLSGWFKHLSDEIDNIFGALDDINKDTISVLVNNFGKAQIEQLYNFDTKIIEVGSAKPWGYFERN